MLVKSEIDNKFYEIFTYKNRSIDLNELRNIKIGNLASETEYELKSKICNQVDCIISTNTITFKTFKRPKIIFFRPVNISSRSIELEWNVESYFPVS